MLSLIASFLLGAAGWVVTSFFTKPLLDFRDLRSKVHEEIIFTGNKGVMTAHTPDYDKAVESLRRLGAKVQAANVSASPPLRWLFSKRGYNLGLAGSNLIGLSNSLNVRGRYLHVHKIEWTLPSRA